MNENTEKWIKEYNENLPLPEPEYTSKMFGWTITIQELQDFIISKEIQSTPDTATFGIKVYISVFNTKTGLFHGRTWSSPLITNITVNFFNLTSHGILVGAECLIVIEFSFCIQYYGNETSENSLFFTVVYPQTTVQHICPLFSGSPRFLLHNPTDFTKVLTTRPGQLIIDLQKNDDLLRASSYMPKCTFMHRPPPGVVKLSPLSLEETRPLIITDVNVLASSDFVSNLKSELINMFSINYKQPPQNFMMTILKFAVHLGVHNSYCLIADLFKAEISENSRWKFDGQIRIPNYVKDPRFALIIQFVVTIELNTDFLNLQEFSGSSRKQMIDIPLGYNVIFPTVGSQVTVKLSRDAQFSPFGSRICKVPETIPSISFLIRDTPIPEKQNDFSVLPVEFKPLIGSDGGSLMPFDPLTAPEDPLIISEIMDKNNHNHIRLLFKFITITADFSSRFPLSTFQRFIFRTNFWPIGEVESNTCLITVLREGVYYFSETNSRDGQKGSFLNADIDLISIDHIINYFVFMKSNELRVQMIDAESGIMIGSFQIQTMSLLRQRRQSLQFNYQSSLISVDGENLGSIHMICGSFGTKDGVVDECEFNLRYPPTKKLIVAESLMSVDKDFKEMVMKSSESPSEMAIRYRNGKRRQFILSDLQRRFLRSKVIYPIPGIENTFTFVSAFEPQSNMFITLSIDDERIRFIGTSKSNSKRPEYEQSVLLKRFAKERFNLSGESLIDRMALIKPPERFSVASNQHLSLDFSFFTLDEIEEKEISISILDESSEILDLFTIQVRRSNMIVHDTVIISIPNGNPFRRNLPTIRKIDNVISSSQLIRASNSQNGIAISSPNVANQTQSYLYIYDSEGGLLKVIKLIINTMRAETQSAGGRIKLNLKHHIGHSICCRTSDFRIARFATFEEPGEIKDTADVYALAISSGVVQLHICDQNNPGQSTSILLMIKDSPQNPSAKIMTIKEQLVFKVGDLNDRVISYKNTSSEPQAYKISTTHPHLVSFEQQYFEIGALGACKLRILFLPNQNEECVSINVLVQEKNKNSQIDCFVFSVQYVN